MKTKLLMTVLMLLALAGLGVQASRQPSPEQWPASYVETVTTESGAEISFEMILVPGGTFRMGSAADEPGRKEDEGPSHPVRISPFYLASTETTLELFLAYYLETKRSDSGIGLASVREGEPAADQADAVTGPTPVYGDLSMGRSQDHPAVGMTWENAVNFCRWLSRKTGRSYRLPSEAEWEYACRAEGVDGPLAGKAGKAIEESAWFEENSDREPRPVAEGAPNGWGFHDLQGNVREWVADFYSAAAYSKRAAEEPVLDPTGPETGRVHVARGGDHGSPAEEIRCAARSFEEDWWRSLDPQLPKSRWWLPMMDHIGFRVAATGKP